MQKLSFKNKLDELFTAMSLPSSFVRKNKQNKIYYRYVASSSRPRTTSSQPRLIRVDFDRRILIRWITTSCWCDILGSLRKDNAHNFDDVECKKNVIAHAHKGITKYFAFFCIGGNEKRYFSTLSTEQTGNLA